MYVIWMRREWRRSRWSRRIERSLLAVDCFQCWTVLRVKETSAVSRKKCFQRKINYQERVSWDRWQAYSLRLSLCIGQHWLRKELAETNAQRLLMVVCMPFECYGKHLTAREITIRDLTSKVVFAYYLTWYCRKRWMLLPGSTVSGHLASRRWSLLCRWLPFLQETSVAAKRFDKRHVRTADVTHSHFIRLSTQWTMDVDGQKDILNGFVTLHTNPQSDSWNIRISITVFKSRLAGHLNDYIGFASRVSTERSHLPPTDWSLRSARSLEHWLFVGRPVLAKKKDHRYISTFTFECFTWIIHCLFDLFIQFS